MSCAKDIRYELLARLCPNSTGADIRSVCTEAGMFAIRARRKVCFIIFKINLNLNFVICWSFVSNLLLQITTEKDFLDAIDKVIKSYSKFSATPKYMVYN